jgi:hypothetical protein
MKYLVVVFIIIFYAGANAQTKEKIIINGLDADSSWGKYLPYRMNNLYGAADPSGKVLIRPQWDSLLSFGDGVGRVMLHKKWGLINTKGALLTKIIYDSIDYSSYTSTYSLYKLDKNEYCASNGKIYPLDLVEYRLYDLTATGAGPHYLTMKVTLFSKEDQIGIKITFGNKSKEKHYFYPVMYDDIKLSDVEETESWEPVPSYVLQTKLKGKSGLILINSRY